MSKPSILSYIAALLVLLGAVLMVDEHPNLASFIIFLELINLVVLIRTDSQAKPHD